MEINRIKSIIEAILFATGEEVKITDLMSALEISREDVIAVIESMKEEYSKENRGIEIIEVNGSYQLSTKKNLYDFVYPIIDNRAKPTLSNAALETLSIIAYNPKITRAEIETIRGVNSDGTIYKLLEYNLIEESGKSDAPGRPMTFSTTNNFLKMFGITSLEDLPELPRYKLDENRQIVIDELLEEKPNDSEESNEQASENEE